MTHKPHIDVYSQTRLLVYGRDLRRIRVQARLSAEILSVRMNNKGFIYYHTKVYRQERQRQLYLDSDELTALIDCIGAHINPK